MNPSAKSIALPFLLLVLMTSLQAQNITVQPPPNPTTAPVLDLKDSLNDNRLIISRRLQTLQLTGLIQNTTPVTQFNLTSFNRRSTGNKDTYFFKLNGTWTHIMSSPSTLSCSIVLENNTNTVGLVRFDVDNKQFKLLGAVPITTFTNMTVNSTLIDFIRNYIFIGEDCQVGSFTDRLSTQPTFTTYRATNNWTQITVIGSIPLPYLQAASDDMNYGIYNNSLYRYNTLSFQYDKVMTFATHERYTLKNSAKRILISACNSAVHDNTTVPITTKNNYTLYVLNDVGNITVVGKILITDVVQQGYHLRISNSPKMTKLGFGYQQVGIPGLKIVAKHIDFTSNNIVDLVYQKPEQFMQTVVGINGDNEIDVSDAFMVVRNGSKFATNPTAPYFEEGYQFVGNQVILLNRRNLAGSPSDREYSSFKKTRLDYENMDKLVVLNLYNNSLTSYSLVQFNFGNLAINRQVTVAPSPPYATFAQPLHNGFYSTPHLLQWGYIESGGTYSNVSVIHIDNSTSSHTSTATYQRPGVFTLNYQSRKCQLLRSPTTNQVVIYKFNSTTKGFVLDGDLSTAMSALIPNASSIWSTSQECDKVRLDSNILHKVNNTNYQPVNNTPNFIPQALDDNFTFAITPTAQIWKFNQTIKGYSLIYNIPGAALLPEKKLIYAHENKVLVTASNSTKVQVLAFAILPDGNFSTCLNHTFLGAASLVQVSPNLTKLLVMGPINATDFKADLFFIDYPNLKNQTIEFPKPAVAKVSLTYVFLDDRFMYIRQLQDKNSTNTSIEYKQSVFFFAQNILAKSVLTNTYVKDTAERNWTRTIILNSKDKTFMVTEVLEKSTVPHDRSIRIKEINAQAAELNSNTNALCQSEIVDGKVKLCPRGCTSCDCTSCISGFVYDSSSKTCLACAPGCIECDASIVTQCTSCYPGFFKNSSNNCQPCQSPCLTCSTSATSCSKCPPGQFFNSGLTQCDNCPANCFNCTNSLTCTTCQPGYVLNPTNKCRKCSIKCSSCTASNITQCISCAKGLQLINGDCTPCPANCLSCNNGQCAECASGYHVNTNGVCVLDCKLPCVTCVQNQPTQCLSCQSGSVLSSSACVIDSSCNTNHSCTDCGQGLNFYLMATSSGTGADCLACPSLPNCLQCSSTNTYKCSMCANGYYVSESSDCSACSTSCTSCISNTICTGCVAGYTLLDGYSQGQCLQCLSPCASCQGSPTYCTSCVSGFTKKNWMCQNNTYITLTFVINSVAGTVLNDIDNIISGLLQILNETNINVITLNSIASGSVIPTISVSPTTTSLSAASTMLTTGLASGIPGTSYSVSGVQVTQNGVTEEPQVQAKSGVNVGLIVGLTVGLTLLVVAIIVTIILVKKAKAAAAVMVQSTSFEQVPVRSKQDVSVAEYSNGIELKETIDVDLQFSKQL